MKWINDEIITLFKHSNIIDEVDLTQELNSEYIKLSNHYYLVKANEKTLLFS